MSITIHNTLQSTSKHNVYLLGLILVIPYTLIYLFSSETSIDLQNVRVLGGFAFIQFLYVLWSWHKLKSTWFDAYIIFTVALYAFMLSQPILEAFDCYSEYRRLWNDFGISPNAYYNATFVSMIGCAAFHFGAIASLNEQIKYSDAEHVISCKVLNIVLRVALFVAIVTMPFYLSLLIKQFALVTISGYQGLYNWEEYTSRTEQILSDGFIPALIVLFTISMIKKRHMKLMTVIVILLVFVPPLYLGGRSNAMLIFSIFFLVYTAVFGMTRKKMIIICLAGVGMLMVMYVVGQIRKSTDRSLDAITATNVSEENPIVSTLEEMGWSMYPTAVSVEAIPEKIEYAYGQSFFWAALSTIPNLGFWDGEHPGKTNDPGTKLDSYVNLGYGIGYSIIAGSFSEFGYWGFIIMWIYGFVFTRILNNASSYILKIDPVKFILAILFLWFSLKFIRNSFDSYVRSLAYYVLPYYLIYKYYLKTKVSSLRIR